MASWLTVTGLIVLTPLFLKLLLYVLDKFYGRLEHHETNSILYWIKWFIIRWFIRSKRRKTEGRFDLYKYTETYSPYTHAILVPPKEYTIERKQSQELLQQKSESITVFSTNAKGQCLLARICRHADHTAEVWLYVRLQDGRSYVLPQAVAVDLSNEEMFQAGGLRMEPLSPMRRWRIAYNGAMRNSKDDSEVVHVKLGFICNSQTDVVDYTRGDVNFTAHLLAKEEWNTIPPDSDRVENVVNGYTQGCQSFGSVTVDDSPEEEFYAWGVRTRSFDPEASTCSVRGHIMGYTKVGISIDMREVRIPEISDSLHIGCVVFPTTQIRPINDCTPEIISSSTELKNNFKLRADSHKLTVIVDSEVDSVVLPFRHNREVCDVNVKVVSLQIDESPGLICYISAPARDSSNFQKPDVPSHVKYLSKEISSSIDLPLAVNLEDTLCQRVELTGGKGSSLAILHELSRQQPQFTVPRGFVVTTSAYKEFSKASEFGSAIKELESCAWRKNVENLQETCQRVVDNISNVSVPSHVSESIQQHLQEIYGDCLPSTRFAIRSSASGEDSEDLSSAGQMDTFLGVQGVQEVLKAVSKCWASQFSHVATEYKRRYGQELDSPMAVVIQEMVPSEVAGVMFTCDPLNGNPQNVIITANYGLGESVVSAQAEPDTITLKRDVNNKLSVKAVQVGSKKQQTVMSESGGIQEAEITAENRSRCCLKEDDAIRLGEIGLIVEKHFSNPRDMEWAFSGKNIYLLQARPVTSLYQESNFEMEHEFDCGINVDHYVASKANVGEVFNGAHSPFGLTFFWPSWMVFGKREMAKKSLNDMFMNPYISTSFVVCNRRHQMFPMAQEYFSFTDKSILSRSMAIAFAGKLIEDDMIVKLAEERKKYLCKTGVPNFFLQFCWEMWYCDKLLKEFIDKYFNMVLPVYHLTNSKSIFDEIMDQLLELSIAGSRHPPCNMYSCFANFFVIALLAHQEGGFTTKVFSDFAKLVGTCNNVVSVDVPNALQELAVVISKHPQKQEFKQKSVEEALEWLMNSDTEASNRFKEFLEKHGHRCVNEFDPLSKPWGMDPKPVVKNLQDMVGVVGDYNKHETTIDEAIGSLEIRFNKVKRIVLKFLISKCRKGVANREHSKSLLIKTADISRRAFLHLADRMVAEGRLPYADLLFFLTLEEVKQLLDGRNPKHLARAYRRQRIHDYLDKLRFPELVKGIPQPIEIKQSEIPASGKKVMNGTPVSQGVIRATARVVNTLEEAVNIKKGDILITYCTDIGWSPYFPLLSGIVTELGGLISHGAVVAREYGLPCVVGCHGATALFRSGEIVVLDGSKGIIQTVDEENGVED